MDQKYLGITPYGEDEDYDFAGRSEETWALYDRIARNDFTVYYASSGEGKSSLIRAGLLPILRRRDYFPVYIVFEDLELEDESSIRNIIDNRIKIETEKYNVSYGQSSWSKSQFDSEMTERLKGNLWWRLRNYCFWRGDLELKPLFIFDQFEEVFTKASYDWTDNFFSWLEEIATDYLPESLRESASSWRLEVPTQKNFKALFSFRTEYLGDLDYWSIQKHFIPSLQANRLCLKALTPEGAKEVISLNSSLLQYADLIISGCAESGSDIAKLKQPCVYALILSVVCQTVSSLPDAERERLLIRLGEYREQTIDKILLDFYEKKLNDAGLDVDKDADVINEIEKALVDDNGKRRRRDSNEESLIPLNPWIDSLSAKDNGLIKVIGRKKKDGEVIKTVELPHDRLCKAIDSSRKERQEKIKWRLKRQKEWMQFGIITVVVAVVIYIWNALMPALKLIIHGLLSTFKENRIIDGLEVGVEISGLEKVWSGFWSYLSCRPSLLFEESLDEGFSTILLMAMLVLFVPLLTMLYLRRGKKWQVISAVVSALGILCFGLLLHRNKTVSFSNEYVIVIDISGLLVCMVLFIIFILRIMKNKKNKLINTYDCDFSWWPLWGGLFLFSTYVFYEFLFRTTFGMSEPKDSSWALLVLPLFSTLFLWSYFQLTCKERTHKKMIFVILLGILVLACLSIMSYLPRTISYKRSYGIEISLILICFYVILNYWYVFYHSDSGSKFNLLTTSKRKVFVGFNSLVLLIVFLLNLGYNPFKIKQDSIIDLNSWRLVRVIEHDSNPDSSVLEGFLYALDGDTILPLCRIYRDSIGDRFVEGVTEGSAFMREEAKSNADNSFILTSNGMAAGRIPIFPTLEVYLKNIKAHSLSSLSTLKDSIDYYAASLFTEIRDANKDFLIKGVLFDESFLVSLDVLEALQQQALEIELNKLVQFHNDSVIFPSDSLIVENRLDSRSRVEKMEDKYLTAFHRELTRTYLLCLLRDRSSKHDVSSMFTLQKTFIFAFLSSVSNLPINMTFNIEKSFKYQTSTLSLDSSSSNNSYHLNHSDVLNEKPAVWYSLFIGLSNLDMSWSRERLNNLFKLSENNGTVFEDSSLLSKGKSSLHSIRSYLDGTEKRLEQLNLWTTMPTEQSFERLKTMVLKRLYAILNRDHSGIYNNDFESVCEHLILASVFRGYDVSNDTMELNYYHKNRNGYYEVVISAVKDIQIAQERVNSLLSTIKQVKPLLLRMEDSKKRTDSLCLKVDEIFPTIASNVKSMDSTRLMEELNGLGRGLDIYEALRAENDTIDAIQTELNDLLKMIK